MAKILITSSVYLPFVGSGVNRISFFKKALEDRGHTVYVLTTSASAQGVKASFDFDYQHSIIRAFSLSKSMRRILSSRLMPIYQQVNFAGKYFPWIPFAVSRGRKLVATLDIDLIFSSFPDFSSLIVGYKLSESCDVPFVCDFRDPAYSPDEEKEKANTFRIKFKKKHLYKSISRADAVTFCTEPVRDLMVGHCSAFSKSSIIPNGYDSSLINCVSQTVRPDSKDYLEIVHIGSFYPQGRNLKPVVEALKKYSNRTGREIKLRLVGDTPDADMLGFLQSGNHVTISIEPPVAAKDALQIAKNADVLLLLQGKYFNRQIPTKCYEYLGLNRIIWAVVGKGGETEKLLDQHSVNVVKADHEDEVSIQNSVEEIVDRKAIEYDSTRLSRQYYSQEFVDIIERVVG